MERRLYYQMVPSRFGCAGLVWSRSGGRLVVIRIFLPQEIATAKDVILRFFPGTQSGSSTATERLGLKIGRYLEGNAVDFNLEELNMSACSAFQRQVLIRTWRIPRGKVVTYGRIAGMLNLPGGARAVGTALARNPFPLVIPCHRVVKSGGDPGGFGGGRDMKKALLEMEGVEFGAAGRVNSRSFI